jgi:hypothetical protein
VLVGLENIIIWWLTIYHKDKDRWAIRVLGFRVQVAEGLGVMVLVGLKNIMVWAPTIHHKDKDR